MAELDELISVERHTNGYSCTKTERPFLGDDTVTLQIRRTRARINAINTDDFHCCREP